VSATSTPGSLAAGSPLIERFPRGEVSPGAGYEAGRSIILRGRPTTSELATGQSKDSTIQTL